MTEEAHGIARALVYFIFTFYMFDAMTGNHIKGTFHRSIHEITEEFMRGVPHISG